MRMKSAILVALGLVAAGLAFQCWRSPRPAPAPPAPLQTDRKPHVQDCAQTPDALKTLDVRLTPLSEGCRLVTGHPQWVEPLTPEACFSLPPADLDHETTLRVRAWRYSYNARGAILQDQFLDGRKTALIVVHPWGVEDGQGFKTPQPAGAVFACTPKKNQIINQHMREVLNPFLQRMRPLLDSVIYSLPGPPDPIRSGLYRTMRGAPGPERQREAQAELTRVLGAYDYTGAGFPETMNLDCRRTYMDNLRDVFPNLSAGPPFHQPGFWDLPIPLSKALASEPQDIVLFDQQGYPALRDFLLARGVRHVLLGGYATNLCVTNTTAGFQNLMQDFDVYLVGDATLASHPASDTPRYATNAALATAALNVFVTEMAWVAPR